MFNQLKQSLLATDEVPVKLGKNIEIFETGDFSLINGIIYLAQPPPANNSWIKKKGWRE